MTKFLQVGLNEKIVNVFRNLNIQNIIMVKIVQRRKIWFTLSSILVISSIAVLLMWGLRFGIDFTGGTLMEFSFKDKTLSSQEIKDTLSSLDLGDINVQFSDNQNVLLRFKNVDENTHQEIIKALNNAVSMTTDSDSGNLQEKDNVSVDDVGIVDVIEATDQEDIEDGAEGEEENVAGEIQADENSGDEDIEITNLETEEEISGEYIEEKRFDSIGPVIGSEMKSSAFSAIIIALIAIVLYIGWAFRKVSRPVSSFKYGLIAMVALFHDSIITLGVFAVLGHFYNVEIGIPFIAAILAILGYSVNDTIVVFDRTRENLLKSGIDDFEEVVNKSVNETLIRSINTSFTTLLVLSALYLFGGETIKYFVVALMIGISFGTYSSIFIASPMLVSWRKWDIKRKNRN